MRNGNKIKLTMSDIVPVVDREGVEIEKNIPIETEQMASEEGGQVLPKQENLSSTINGIDDLLSHIADEPMTPEEHIEALMSHNINPIVELASVGARFPEIEAEVFRDEFSTAKNSEDEFYRKIIRQIREPLSSRISMSLTRVGERLKTESSEPNIPVVQTAVVKTITSTNEEPAKITFENRNNYALEAQVKSFYRKQQDSIVREEKIIQTAVSLDKLPKSRPLNFHMSVKKKKIELWIFLTVAVALVTYGFALKHELFQNSVTAFNDLEQAGESLKKFDFAGAAQNFEKSYESFSNISQTMTFVGAGLAGFFADLPGFDNFTAGSASKIKSAKDLTEAGRLIAQSGQAVSEALKSLAQTGSILNPGDKDNLKPSRIISQIKTALFISDKNFKNAMALISAVDESVIPEDKREKLSNFKDKIPLMEEYLGNAIRYTEFLEQVVGIDEPKKYLLLFQNNSELRPTGGFPGTYGVVSFAGGGLADFFVNDVYNLDGQLKQNIIPPKQLQHITPVWGMRDSAWFIDFPTSAKKVMSFFLAEAGYGVDGIITLNPDIVSKILEIVGPVKMPEYDMILNSDNFLATIQEEVEYGDNRTQPKKVVSDFAPRFLEKLYSADADKWMKIFNIFMAGLDENDIMFYFADKELEKFVVQEGFAGEVKGDDDSDYLTVNFTNVKGSKTDAVTDTSFDIETVFKNGQVIHKVSIVRHHNGGDHEHGFYNRQNPSYVRILLPSGAELIDINGNDVVNYRPLLNYAGQADFVVDGDLRRFEDGFYRSNFTGVDKFSEAGKQGVGFWMVVDPDSSQEVVFTYSVPVSREDYKFYFQKQSGLKIGSFSVSLPNLSGEITESSGVFNVIGDTYILDQELRDDFYYEVRK